MADHDPMAHDPESCPTCRIRAAMSRAYAKPEPLTWQSEGGDQA